MDRVPSLPTGASLLAMLLAAGLTATGTPARESSVCPEGTSAPSSAGARPEVVIIGSSSAAGQGASTRTASYAWRLGAWIAANRPDGCAVNLARGGYTTWHLRPLASPDDPARPRIDTARNIEAALARHPRLVVLHLPSNDAAEGIPLDESVRNLEGILSRTRAAGVALLVVGAQPRPLDGDENRLLRLWARALDTLSATESVNVWDSLALDSTRMKPWLTAPDGFHLNDSGHALVYRQILRSRTWRTLFPAP